MTEQTDTPDPATPPTEAEALMHVAKAIRELPREAKRVERAAPLGPWGISEQMLGTMNPEKIRERKREMKEEKRAERAELRANIAIVIAALGAIGSILAVVLH